MELLEKFEKNIFSTKESFDIVISGKNLAEKEYYHFLQDKVGNARYIYGKRHFYDANFYSSLDSKFELVAIVVDKTVYIVDDFYFHTYSFNSKNVLSKYENIKRFSDFVKEETDYIRKALFPKFYDDLKIKEITSLDEIETCYKNARYQLLSPNSKDVEKLIVEHINNIFSENEFARVLCGLLDLSKETRNRLNIKKDYWTDKKSFYYKVEQLIKEGNVAEDWELEIAKGLRNIDAKNVIVEFTVNNKTASAKIEPYQIIRNMIHKDSFDSYDFPVRKHGEELLEHLGVGGYWNSEQNITCKEISKIMYRGKNLYIKETK